MFVVSDGRVRKVVREVDHDSASAVILNAVKSL